MDPLTRSIIEASGSEVLARYVLAALLLGALALLALLARWLLGWAWYRWIGDVRAGDLERARAAKRARELPNDVRVEVTRVIDGDTFDARLGDEIVRVRVLGLDTPEKVRGRKAQRDAARAGSSVTQQIELGEDATRRARSLLDGARVTLCSGREDRGPRKDLYDRYLAYVELPDGRDYGLVMIKEGRGECFGWKYPHPRKAQYQAAQERASSGLGRAIAWLRRRR